MDRGRTFRRGYRLRFDTQKLKPRIGQHERGAWADLDPPFEQDALFEFRQHLLRLGAEEEPFSLHHAAFPYTGR